MCASWPAPLSSLVLGLQAVSAHQRRSDLRQVSVGASSGALEPGTTWTLKDPAEALADPAEALQALHSLSALRPGGAIKGCVGGGSLPVWAEVVQGDEVHCTKEQNQGSDQGQNWSW